MSEFSYPTPKDNNNTTKVVPLYHHEQVPFHSIQQQQRQVQKQPCQDDQWKNMATSPQSCDLQDVIFYYQSQPELLRLILLSKVEEDKRRAEEAKLRAKELDLLLLQQRQQTLLSTSPLSTAGTVSAPTTGSLLSSPPPCENQMTSMPHTGFELPNRTGRRPSLDAILDSPQQRRDSPLTSSLGASSATHSEELDDRAFSPFPTTTATSQISSYPPQMMPMKQPVSPYMDEFPFQMPLPGTTETNYHHQHHHPSPPAPVQQQRFDPYRPRRRREMQAITKIVETREYPYVDGYFWKNNGNTVQKKTGNKSVYYKCSNSTKGCPVNKTVTWKGNGEYLIKYRGEHLPECGKVQRIVDM